MKTKLKGLALTAMLLSSTSVTFADQGGSSVGDLPGYDEDAYFDEQAAYAESNHVAHTGHATDSPVGYPVSQPQYYQATQYAPVGVSELQAASFAQHYSEPSSQVSGGCSSACDSACGGCDSAYGGSRMSCFSMGGMFGCRCRGWATSEALLWWAPDRRTPPLVTTSAQGTLPIIGVEPTTQVVFGDDVNGELSGGFRGDYGTYITNNVGIGGRIWFFANNNDSFFGDGDGSDRSIGRPFFNTSLGPGGLEDAFLVAQDGLFTGAVAANSKFDVWGAEGYGRLRFSCTKSSQLDFIGGYSRFEINDQLAISSTTFTDASGRNRSLTDLFKARNVFDGGQIGFEMVMKRGRWSARSLTKVHLGNMNQRMIIAGTYFDQTPPGAPVIESGGLLARGNQGTFERNKFTFVPEANFKLALCLRKNVSFSVGYSFIYWDKVTLAGDNVDRDVDLTNFPTGFGSRPTFDFNDSGLWVQGIDLGLVIDI